MRTTQLTTLALIAILPSLASAWMPVAPEMAGPPTGPGYPIPYGQSFAPPVVPMSPGDRDVWPFMPPGPFDPMTPMDRRGGGHVAPRSQMRISRQTTPDAYLIDIGLANIDPNLVEIQPAGRGLIISYSTRTQTTQEETLPRGEGFRRSYSVSRGSANRRIALPPDANLGNLSREVTDDHIRVRIPRDLGGRWPFPIR